MTVSLRKDEYDKLSHLSHKSGHHLTKHAIVKLAIREFLFPEEEHHEVDGLVALMSKDKRQIYYADHITIEDDSKKKVVLKKEPET